MMEAHKMEPSEKFRKQYIIIAWKVHSSKVQTNLSSLVVNSTNRVGWLGSQTVITKSCLASVHLSSLLLWHLSGICHISSLGRDREAVSLRCIFLWRFFWWWCNIPCLRTHVLNLKSVWKLGIRVHQLCFISSTFSSPWVTTLFWYLFIVHCVLQLSYGYSQF